MDEMLLAREGTTGKGHPAWANLSPEALVAQEGQQEGQQGLVAPGHTARTEPE